MALLTSDFDYDLPEELIAQTPASRRDESRLLVLDRATGEIRHDRFSALGGYLAPGDLLVANRSKVIPARLLARKPTGGHVEILLVRPRGDGSWTALARPSRKLREGLHLTLPESAMSVCALASLGGGEWLIELSGVDDVDGELQRVGTVPLPPYIHNGAAPAERYQTVYADRAGSVAAPTAGLHFSEELIGRLAGAGVDMRFVTLHIGLGTFKPVSAERVEDHRLHAEWGEVSSDVAEAVNQARAHGHRVVAVGTTSTRLLETAGESGTATAFSGDTDRFIYPGYRFRVVDALITNFHLPRSSLLMLVSAFAGLEAVRAAYAEAIRERYRFYSFGDAMMIL